MSDVWALGLVTSVQEIKPTRPGREDTFTPEQLSMIVDMRDHGDPWELIGRRMKRSWKSCQRRYFAIKQKIGKTEPAPRELSAAAAKPYRLHEELGIQTYRVMVTVIDARGNIRLKNVTLSAGFSS
jgi:hypothetical protein